MHSNFLTLVDLTKHYDARKASLRVIGDGGVEEEDSWWRG